MARPRHRAPRASHGVLDDCADCIAARSREWRPCRLVVRTRAPARSLLCRRHQTLNQTESMLKDAGSISAKTGTAPSKRTQLAEATKLKGVVITSSPVADSMSRTASAAPRSRCLSPLRIALRIGREALFEFRELRTQAEKRRPEDVDHGLNVGVGNIRTAQRNSRLADRLYVGFSCRGSGSSRGDVMWQKAGKAGYADEEIQDAVAFGRVRVVVERDAYSNQAASLLPFVKDQPRGGHARDIRSVTIRPPDC